MLCTPKEMECCLVPVCEIVESFMSKNKTKFERVVKYSRAYYMIPYSAILDIGYYIHDLKKQLL